MNERKINQPGSGRAKPAATRLKELPAETRAKVLEILADNTYKDAEPLVESLTGFFCSADVLYRFRKWHKTRKAMEVGREILREIQAFLREEMPEASPETVRELGVMFYALACLANGDAKGFVNLNKMQVQSEREQIRARKVGLEERKFQESLRTKRDAGLYALTDVFRHNPEALKLFEQAKEVLGKDGLQSSKVEDRERRTSNIERRTSNDGAKGTEGEHPTSTGAGASGTTAATWKGGGDEICS